MAVENYSLFLKSMPAKRYVLLMIQIVFPVLCMAHGNLWHIGPGERHGAGMDSLQVTGKQAAYKPEAMADSLAMDTLSVENKRFYDSLAVKSNRKGFTRFLYNALIVPSTSGPTNHTPMAVTDEATQYRRFEGTTIRSIEIVTNDVFERPVSILEKGMNAVHITTRKSAIRHDLLFREGDMFDADRLVQCKQLLMSRDYLYAVHMEVVPVAGDPSAVDVKVVTHDSWTINVDGSVTGLTGRVSGDIYDANLLGMGNKLRYRLSLDWRHGLYEGSLFEYYATNIFGTFFTGRFLAGRSFWNTQYRAELHKRFLVEQDYEVGAIFNDQKTRHYILYADPGRYDIDEPVKYTNFEVWLGKSFHLPSIESSIYGMAAWYGVRFDERPDYTAKGMNPAFQNRNLWLGSLGLYREKFLTTNMIYGYGFTEYIATGYKAEIIGGYLSGEFDSGVYAGASVRAGQFTSAGYFTGSAAMGGFYNPTTERVFQAALNLRLDYFTNLLRAGRTHIRQFVSLNYVKGWNRAGGVEEWIRLTKESGPRGLPGYTRGRERAVINTETVVFTPWQPLGFRVALYGYVDAGLIGDSRNIFRNDFYSTAGIGIRLKNEMFVFGILQLTLSVALNGKGFMRNDEWIVLNEGSRMPSNRYIPEQPKIVEYR